jgi:hypothetical protein
MGDGKLIPFKWTMAILLFAGSACGQSFEEHILDRIQPLAPVVITGYGGLTVGQNYKGTISVCRWPEPGSANHISPDGLQWGVIIEGELQWLSHDQWTPNWMGDNPNSNVLRWQYSHETANIRAVVTTSIHPDKSLLITDIKIEGLKPESKLFWHSAFAPVTKRPSEIIDPNISAGFAAYVDSERKSWRHFRPNVLDRDAYERREKLQFRDEGLSSWETFSDGVWIESWVDAGYEIREKKVDEIRDPTGPMVIEIAPTFDGTAHRAEVRTLFAKDSEELKTLKGTLRALSLEELTEIQKSNPLIPPVEFASTFLDTQFLTEYLFRLTSNKKPRLVRAVAPASLAEKDWPMWGAQMALGMNAMGFREEAEKIVDAYLKKVKIQPLEPNYIYGSLPMAHYFDNTLAAPHYAFDFHSPAWVSFSVMQLGLSMPKQEQKAYWQSRFESLGAMGSFFADWGGKYPLHPSMYIEEINMDEKEMNFESNAASWLGLQSVIFIGEAIGMPIPTQWRYTLQELETQLRIEINKKYDHLMLLSGKFRYSTGDLDELAAHRQTQIQAGNTENHWHKLLEDTLLMENYPSIVMEEPGKIFQFLRQIEYTTPTKRDVTYYLDGLKAAQVLQIVSILEK